MSNPLGFIKKVCQEQGIEFNEIEKDFFLSIHFTNKDHYMMDSCLGINNEVEERLMKDKYSQYLVLAPHVAIPETRAFFDPQPPYTWTAVTETKPIDSMVHEIDVAFKFPIVVKRNRGTRGRHVFMCQDLIQAKQALENIYAKDQIEYDHVALVQQYIQSVHEYRVMMYRGKAELIHYKHHKKAEFCGSLNPERWREKHQGYISLLDKPEVIEFAERVMAILPIRYCGLDIIEDKTGKLWLLELNGTPLVSDHIASEYEAEFLKLYRQLVADLALISR
jgi:glutathione synthase/RimK-type ligase-like ATP-grasp enzyme